MITQKTTFFSSLAATMLAPVAMHAALINVDINSDRFPTRDPGTFTTTGAVPLGSAGDAWTGLTRASGASTLTATDLATVGGGSSTVDLSITGYANDFAANVPGGSAPQADTRSPNVAGNYIYNDLMGDYLFVNNGPITVTLTGLTDGTDYDLVVYAHGADRDDNGTVTITTGTPGTGVPASGDAAFWTGAREADLTEGLDYVRFSSIQSDGGSIVFTITESGVGVAAINGLQLFSTPIPEPASVVLLGLGSAFVVGRRRRA